jgi:hypothetical protein
VDDYEMPMSIALAGLLVVIAVYFGYCQQQMLAQLRLDTDLPADDRRYLHRQAVRRLINSVLLLVLAGFFIGWCFIGPQAKELLQAEPGAEIPQEAKDSLRLVAAYVIGGLLLVLVVLVIAVVDLFATARYGARHRRQLVNDRRAALHAEVERLRRDRQGLNGEGHS